MFPSRSGESPFPRGGDRGGASALIALVPLLVLLGACVQSRPLFDQDEDGYMAWDDCNDQDATIGPLYRDLDGDGIGAGPWDAGCGLTDASGYSARGTDCNDQNSSVSPDLPEICDQLDNDCDGIVDNGSAQTTEPEDTCNGVDNNCNGMEDEQADLDQDGAFDCDSAGRILDCNDHDSAIYPGAIDYFGDGVDTNCNGFSDILVTTAGNGSCCFAGDGDSAVDAVIGNPGGMDRNGTDLFLADPGSHRIRRISSAGVITTLAGTGKAGYEGDGGVASAAQLNSPSDVAFDSRGNLFIADTGNHCIRRIDVTGKVSTVAGQGGKSGYSGDNDVATKALLKFPAGVLIDEDSNILIADTNNHAIRRVSTGSDVITTIAGTGAAGFSGEGQPAANAQLSSPTDLTLIGNRRLVIADTGNHVVRLIDNQGIITSFAGVGGVGGYAGDEEFRSSALLNRPTGVLQDGLGFIYAVDSGNHRVRMIDLDGIIHTVAGAGVQGFSGDGGEAVNAELNYPFAAELDTEGNLVIADTGNHRLRTLFW